MIEGLNVESRVGNRRPGILTAGNKIPQFFRAADAAGEPTSHSNNRQRHRLILSRCHLAEVVDVEIPAVVCILVVPVYTALQRPGQLGWTELNSGV